MPHDTFAHREAATPEERERISDLLGFAGELLNARAQVQMVMQSGLGVFHEKDFDDLPGIELNCDDGAWLRLKRLSETRPPEPADHVSQFLDQKPNDPNKAPSIKPAISVEVTIEEASDLIEMGLLMPGDVRVIVENEVEIENRVKVILHASNCSEMRLDFEAYLKGPWSDWAHHEKPNRRAISIYKDLFNIHSVIHTSEGTPPELVWGTGIGRWKTRGANVDMPIIEQSLDIELEDEGVIAIRPRATPPSLSLKPYIQLGIDGASKLQRELQDNLDMFLRGDAEFTPFTSVWEPLLDTAASNIASDAVHITREALNDGEKIESASDQLRITSSWAIFGRPRSNEYRIQDIQKLRAAVADEGSPVPPPIRGFTEAAKEEAPNETSEFGVDQAVLTGVAVNTWEPSASGDVGASPRESKTSGDGAKKGHSRVHFFPLPFNEEQGKISDMIDDRSIDVVCVSGPPGTGKSHSIANIISHQMALGNRVLVTARTPEAIAAVREKLPKSLRSLVIASVGTDRDSAQQLQEAVTELSNEVVGLDVDDANRERAKLEQKIIDCDAKIQQADIDLARIARANLDQMEWNDSKRSPMEIVELLLAEQATHGWFTDRPTKRPPAQLDDTLARLRETLPKLAPDIVYAGANLPENDSLPTTADIVSAHQTDLAWNQRETVDYSSAPTMAFDGTGSEEQGRAVLRELNELKQELCEAPQTVQRLASFILKAEEPFTKLNVQTTRSYIGRFEGLPEAKDVRFNLGDCRPADFKNAAQRGLAGQSPVGFSLFNKPLKSAVASVEINGAAPERLSDWKHVLDTYRLTEETDLIIKTLSPFIEKGLFKSPPSKPWEIADYLIARDAELEQALKVASRVQPIVAALTPLFPVGLDLDALCGTLDCDPAIHALRANLPDQYEEPKALAALRFCAGDRGLPVLDAIGDLADAIGKSDTSLNDIVQARGAITRELARLSEVSAHLERLGVDLDALSDCGAPEWVERLREGPERAAELIPDNWRASWSWGLMKGRVDRIVAMGNGDDLRKLRADAMKRRSKALEKLIRVKTLIGLKARMSPSIRQAMEAFTQAVGKIGTGKGKKAPRFIRAAQEAAQKASSAAPVWIMPEYKIPEQLPAKFGDFDLVVLDEASQSDITAISALARGKKILVVGDEEQVSPSVVGVEAEKVNALRAEFLEGIPSADLIDENTSIFEMTKRMHPESHVMLREHFRCVAPIINFSTRFYNNALVPLRVPKASERFDPPLVDVFIPDAERDGPTNSSEAKWIVDEIARIIAEPEHAGRDIGVISLIGSKQAEMIGRMLVDDPRVGTEKIKERRIIYGDARTMQGQERSIVFLSMVATSDTARAQTSKADQQRFNVAMSRAKDRLYLVRSVELDDLKSNDIKSKVIQHFADPMPDGRAITKGESNDLMSLCESGFEREVLGRLMEANYRVRPQVSAGKFFIDLVVEGAEDRRLAIELDGDIYHGPDVWDQDMQRQAALERAGWVFWRVFGSQWATNKDYWWSNLRQTLALLDIEPIGAAAIDERFTESITVYPDEDWQSDGPDFLSEGNEEGDDLDQPSEDPTVGREATQEEPTEVDAATEDVVDSSDHEVSKENKASSPSDAPKQTEPDRKPILQSDLPLEGDLFSPRPPKVSDSETDTTVETPMVQIGTKVRLEKLEKGNGKMVVTIVSERDHDPSIGNIGVHTPLGEALLDKEVGETAEYLAGAYVKEVRVLEFL